MAGAACPRGAACHHGGPPAYGHRRAPPGVGPRVVVACALHVVIEVDPGALPRGRRIALRRQGPARRAGACGTPLLA